MKRIISIFLLTTVIVSLLASCGGQESTLIDFLSMDDERQLLCFCYTDIHNQQAMLDYPTTGRRSLILATELARDEFGLADMAIVGIIDTLEVNREKLDLK